MKTLSTLFALVLCCCAIGCGGSTSGNFDCLIAASQTSDQGCLMYTGVASSSVSSAESACTSSGGTVVSSCPTANLVGCCTTTAASYTDEACYYGSGTASTYESACTSASGTWATHM